MIARPVAVSPGDGYRAGIEAIARIWEPRVPPSIAEWADRFRILPAKTSAEPGQWRTARIPYLRGIMAALEPTHPAPLVVFAKSSQVGGSEIALNWIGATMATRPRSFLALFPTERVAARWVRSRCNPMIASTPDLRRLLPTGRHSGANAGNTLHEKHFPGGVLYTGSANRPDDVASISVPCMLFDEADRMPHELKDEGDPVELAMRRAATFWNSKSLAISSPTDEDVSRIWPLWLASTMDRYFVPCVHCGAMQVLRWEGLVWPSGKPAAAAFQCAECAALIEEHAKTDLLAAGEWRSEHPDREGAIKGFHVNALYTPIGLGDSWGRHAEAWERAQGKPARLRVFYNTRLGIAYRGDRRAVEWEELKARAEPRRLREIPPGVLVLTAATDTQGDRLETQVIGWGRGECATPIDYQVHYGDTSRPEVWAQLDEYLARPFDNAHGVPMRIVVTLVDAGYRTEHVLAFTRSRRARGIFASRGSPLRTRAPIGRPSYPDTKKRGRKVQPDTRGAERYEIGVTAIKTWLFDQLAADVGRDGQLVTPANRHVRFPDALPDDYFRQLAAETFDPRKGWEKTRFDRNEALDTFVGARAAAMHHLVGVHKFSESDWVRLEAIYEPTKPAQPDEAAVPATAEARTSSGLTIDDLRDLVPHVKPT